MKKLVYIKLKDGAAAIPQKHNATTTFLRALRSTEDPKTFVGDWYAFEVEGPWIYATYKGGPGDAVGIPLSNVEHTHWETVSAANDNAVNAAGRRAGK